MNGRRSMLATSSGGRAIRERTVGDGMTAAWPSPSKATRRRSRRWKRKSDWGWAAPFRLAASAESQSARTRSQLAATASARSVAVSCWAASGASGAATQHASRSERVGTRLIYLLLFIAPQVLVYLYLRERLPDPTRPRQARVLRAALAGVFVVFNLPWLAVAWRVLFDTVWGVSWVPFIGPFMAWQLLGWVFCGLVAVYLAFKGILWVVGRWERWKVGRTDPHPEDPF